MNYINHESYTPQLIKFNTLATPEDAVLWTLYMEGSPAVIAESNSSSVNVNLTDGAYFQTLSIDFFSEGVTLQGETQYMLKGTLVSDDTLIYSGKLFTTSQNVYEHEVNGDKFIAPDVSNEFIII